MRNLFFLFIIFLMILGAIGFTGKPIRIGLIGLDTSHAPAFTELLNDATNEEHVPGAKVVAAFAGGSPEVEASYTRVEQYTNQIRDEYQVEIVPTIEDLVKKVDAIILTSVDGQVHLAQVKPVISAGKPVFIDKPMAASLDDVLQIFALAKEENVPCWSASSLRFYPELQTAIKDTTLGRILGCEAYSPATLEPHHPDLFWYGIHGVEILFTIMGPEIKTVTRVYTERAELVTGVWEDGRLASFRGSREGKGKYGAIIYYENGVKQAEPGKGSLYKPLVDEIVQFFKTGKPPIEDSETLAIFKFMDAAQKSKDSGNRTIMINK
jgi:predicted dehydrogenase